MLIRISFVTKCSFHAFIAGKTDFLLIPATVKPTQNDVSSRGRNARERGWPTQKESVVNIIDYMTGFENGKMLISAANAQVMEGLWKSTTPAGAGGNRKRQGHHPWWESAKRASGWLADGKVWSMYAVETATAAAATATASNNRNEL